MKDSRDSAWNNDHFGYYFFHEDYLKLKVLSFLVHGDAVKELLARVKRMRRWPARGCSLALQGETMEEVRVKRSLLFGLLAVAGVALLAVAFLLGRTSGSGHAEGIRSQGQAAVVLGPEARSAEEPSLRRIPGESPTASVAVTPPSSDSVPFLAQERPDSSRAAPAPVPPTAGELTPTGDSAVAADPAATAVATYLADVDQIQPANLSGSPESVAGEMATALARGDTSGLDAMIRQTEAAKEKLAAVRPPAPCAVHYQKSLESLDDAVEMLRALKSSMQSPDPVSGLASVQARASILQTRAEALQNEDRALRQRYGLTR